MTSFTRWQVLNPECQLRYHWANEGEWVVFNEASGDLHLLNAEALTVLDRLVAGPASIEELLHAVGCASPDAIRRVVDNLDSLGLVSPLLP